MKSDEELIGEYRNGREMAFEELIHRHLKPVFNFIRRYTTDPAIAEDATQETFIKAWRHLPRFARDVQAK